MDTREYIENRMTQIRNKIDNIGEDLPITVTLNLIDFTTDSLETKQKELNITTLQQKSTLIQLLVRKEFALSCALGWYNHIHTSIPGGFTTDHVEQFVNYYVARIANFDDDDIVRDFIVYIKAIAEAAKEESKTPANLRY